MEYLFYIYVFFAFVKFSMIVRFLILIYKCQQVPNNMLAFFIRAIISCLLWPYGLINHIVHSYGVRNEKRRRFQNGN
jgi:type III secretory pathway component EscR